MAFCVKCGQSMEGAFCGACGAPAEVPVEAPAAEAPVYAAPAAEAPAAEAPAYEAPAYEAPAYEAPAYEAPAYAAPAEPVKKGLPKWVIPTAIAVVAAIVAVVLFFAFGGSNIGKTDAQLIEARVEALEQAFSNGDWNGVVACMDSASREMIEGNSEMAQVEAYFGMIGGMMKVDFSVSDIEIEGNTATAEIEMSITVLGQTQSESEEATFVKEGNDWFMSGGAGDLLGM